MGTPPGNANNNPIHASIRGNFFNECKLMIALTAVKKVKKLLRVANMKETRKGSRIWLLQEAFIHAEITFELNTLK